MFSCYSYELLNCSTKTKNYFSDGNTTFQGMSGSSNEALGFGNKQYNQNLRGGQFGKTGFQGQQSQFQGQQSQSFRPPNPTRFDQIPDQQPITTEHLMGLMGESSNMSASSGYQSGQSPTHTPSKEYVQKTIALQQMLSRPVTPEDCSEMKKTLEGLENRTAFKNPYKGPDSFFYCLSKYVHKLSASSDPHAMVSGARTGLGKFIAENKDYCSVSTFTLLLFFSAKMRTVFSSRNPHSILQPKSAQFLTAKIHK